MVVECALGQTLVLNLGAIISHLCDRGPVTHPLWASNLPHLDDRKIPSQL